MQEEFDDILLQAQESFRLNDVPLEKFRLKATSLCVSKKHNIPMFEESKLEKINTYSCDELFHLLTRMEVWDILNFQVLQGIVKKFIPNDIETCRRIGTYALKVSEFKEATLLRDYVRIKASGTKAMPGYTTVMVKINENYGTFTLANVAEEEEFLENEFLLNQFIFRLSDGDRGCVQITWLVPASAMPLFMPEKLAEKGEALKKRGILKIRVDNRYVYMVNIALLIIIFP